MKRRAEEQLYKAYTATFQQLIMQHKSTDNMPAYAETLKDIYSDIVPKQKKQTAAEVIEQTRKNIRR